MKVLLIFSILLLVAVVTFGVASQFGPWGVYAEGTYASVEYTKVVRHHGPPVSYDYDDYNTIIRFTDGRTAIMHGQYEMKFPSGTVIRILIRGGVYKIEKI